jgi:hypothetical protein
MANGYWLLAASSKLQAARRKGSGQSQKAKGETVAKRTLNLKL